MRSTPAPVDEIIRVTLGDPGGLLSRPLDRAALRTAAEELHVDPYTNLSKLVESALHPKTEDYLIVTDLDAEAKALRRFVRRRHFAYRALRRRLMRDEFTRGQLRERATGLLRRVTCLDVFRYIADTSRGATAVSLFGKAVVLLLPGFHHPETARASLEAGVEEHPVLSKLADFSDPDLLSFVIRLHTRHEAAHSEDGMQHRAGVRNRYAAEPESDAAMTLFAMREAHLLDHEFEGVLRSVAMLRELTGEIYFFCGRTIRHALDVDLELLLRLEDREVTALADALADTVVPSYETLTKVESALAEMWRLTRYRIIRRDPDHPRHERMRDLLHDEDVEAWISQTLAAFEHFGVCPKAQRERVLEYARDFYASRRSVRRSRKRSRRIST